MPKVDRKSIASRIWDRYIGNSRDTIPLLHLPIKKVVLQRYRGIRASSEDAGNPCSKAKFFDDCWQELQAVWKAARIPVIQDHNGLRKTKELVEWFEKICANTRYLEGEHPEITEKLNTLFDVAPSNLYQQMKSSMNPKWKTDYDFYLNQQIYPQTQMISGCDMKTTDLEERRAKRIETEVKRNEKEAERQRENVSPQTLSQSETAAYDFWWWDIDSDISDHSDVSDDDCQNDPDWKDPSVPPAKKYRKAFTKKPDTMTVEMNLKSIFENTTAAAIRAKLTAAQHLELLSSFVNQCTDASTESVTASLSTCKRQRKKKIKMLSKKIHKSFIPPKFPSAHWDGKCVKYLSGEAFDHEAVCLSGPLDLAHPQFLGAPVLDPATGQNTAAVTREMLEAWNIDLNELFATIWDTTAVNSGVENGACACLERERGSAYLWCACRHHIYEIHMTHVYEVIRGRTTATEDPVMKRFKGLWTPYQHGVDNLTTFTWPRNQQSPRYILANKTREYVRQCMQNMVFEREDTMELVELVAAVLDIPIVRHGQARPLSIRCVGAIHHARFMAKALVVLKMFLLYQKYRAHFTNEEWRDIKKVADFVVLIWARYYLQSSLPAHAPRLDLELLEDAVAYRGTNRAASTALVNSLTNHLWYLCPELVVLSLFDEAVSDQQKSAVAQAILQHPIPAHFAPGKPGGRKFEQVSPILQDFITRRTPVVPSLSAFVTERSWLLFHLVGRGAAQWLEREPEEWPLDEDYMFTSRVVHDMLVVNDCAERNIKDITDYIRTVRNVNGMLDDIILVGEDRRSLVPNLNRENLLNA